MRELVAEEIVPNIPGDQNYLRAFADKILERFYNPFIRHEWAAISLNSMSKWETRVLPSLLDAITNADERERTLRTLAGLLANPNVGGFVAIDSGRPGELQNEQLSN